MMGRTKIWAVAAALALLPGAALAQQAAGTAPNPAVAPANEDQGTTAKTVAPAVPAERVRSEAATTPKPQLEESESLTPGAPVPADQGGSTSATLKAGQDAEPIAPLNPVPGFGQPDGGWNLQDQVTPIGVEARKFNDNILLPLMAVVTLIVFVLLLFAMVRYRAASNPVPSKTSHNTLVEVIWTVVPVLILVWIAIPSFRLLANQYDPPKPDLTIKATGHQWYWEYEYPDHGGFSFDAIMLTEQDSEARGVPRLLETDNRVVVPVNATVKVLVTAADVIHSWAIPAFWVKMDGVPGRINETWFKAEREGVYYGQCSELCGTKHAFMPIAIEVVSPERFAAWIAAKQAENGIDPATVGAAAAATDGEATAAPTALR